TSGPSYDILFFCNATATTQIYTLSLHDALPILDTKGKLLLLEEVGEEPYNIDRMLTQLRLSGKLEEANGIILGDWNGCEAKSDEDRKSTRLNSSHVKISYAVFCLKKKKEKKTEK